MARASCTPEEGAMGACNGARKDGDQPCQPGCAQRAPPAFAGGDSRRAGAKPRLLLLTALHVLALGLFVRGFLLTRVHLPQRSEAPSAPAVSPPASSGGSDRRPTPVPAPSPDQPPYTKLVWLMIDALRYDMVVTDRRYACTPRQTVCHQGRMGYLSRLLAEHDDNLLFQLKAAGKRLAFMGDATWHALFPDLWDIAHPFPCFNVKDLHTVDDGIWEHLLPALRSEGPGAWDVLVAHYLGVDHCGHSHGVGSEPMVAKLRQMDDHVRQAVEELVAQAGRGGAHERTLLLVSGDHGQTLGGDHGGGSPEEVDSALVAIDLGALAGARAGAAAAAADGGGTGSAARGTAAGAARGTAQGLALCRASCTCGVEANQCAPDLAQNDLTPTLAALLGVPIPFGNVGAVSAELWALAARHPGGGAPPGLAHVLAANADQVHRYLNAYATARGTAFSAAALARLNAQHAALPRPGPGAPAAAAAEAAAACRRFLSTASDVARREWTQFRALPMAAGLSVLAGSLLLQLAWVLAPPPGGRPQRSIVRASAAGLWRLLAGSSPATALLAGVAAAHAAGIFSFFFLLSEGMCVSYLLAADFVILAAAAAWPAGPGRKRATAAGAAALACDAALAALGLAHHSGQGFWHRLTVHEGQGLDQNVARGWQAALAPLQAAWRAALAAAGTGGGPWPALAAHAATCSLPLAALAALLARRLRGCGASWALLSGSFLSAMLCAGAFHLAESLQPTLGKHFSASQLLQLLSRALGSSRAGLAAALTAALAPLAALAGPAGGALAAAPLRLLLPQATYALCCVSAALWLRLAAGGGSSLQDRTAALAAALLPAVLQVSDAKAALVLLLGAAEAAAAARLLARRGGPARGGAAALALAAIQAQMFFVSGHLCEFAGLRYTAAFVGYDQFRLWRGAVLMTLETFGTMLLAAAVLPLVVAAACGDEGDGSGRAAAGAGGGAAGDAAGAADAPVQQQRQARAQEGRPAHEGGEEARAQAQALLVLQLARAATALAAALSAAIQRRHLYAWALFAPKFVFEAAFLLATDLALLAA
eukprot:scaffold9.g3022.t1